MDKLSYALGLNIGHQLKEMGLRDTLVASDYTTAIEDVLKGNAPKISIEEASSLLETFFSKLEEQRQSAAKAAGEAAKSEGERFLAENAKSRGSKSLPAAYSMKCYKRVQGKPQKPLTLSAATIMEP